MRAVSLLHTADVHLGSTSAPGREEEAFVRAVDLAREAAVDAVLITGDLFDHARVPDELLAWTAGQLDRLPCPVVLLAGNHDTLHDASVHHRFRVPERCGHVQLLDDPDGSAVEVPEADLVVWGRAMEEHQPGFRPLDGLPPRPDGAWAVVAAHGLAGDDEVLAGRSSPITDAELDAVDWDYVALGHVHGHRVLRGAPRPIVYPGATAASKAGEAGVVLVSLTPGVGASVEWTSLAPTAVR